MFSFDICQEESYYYNDFGYIIILLMFEVGNPIAQILNVCLYYQGGGWILQCSRRKPQIVASLVLLLVHTLSLTMKKYLLPTILMKIPPNSIAFCSSTCTVY